MRKKQGRSNQRKSKFPLFIRSRRALDETDWILLEADLSEASARVRKPRKLTAWGIRLLGFACLCVTLPMGIKWTHDAIFYKNDEFILSQLGIESDGALNGDLLAEVANVSEGMSLMDLDLELIRNRIEKLPNVKQATVTRVMPDALQLVVCERDPVAWLSCPPLGIRPGDMERGYLLDEDGVVFRCLDLDEEVRELPVIETFQSDEPVEGLSIEADGIASALDLIVRSGGKLAQHAGMNIHVVRLRNEWSLECHYRSGLRVTFALHEIDRGLRDLAAILEKADDLPAPVATVNVAARDNIPITFSTPVNMQTISAIASPVTGDAAAALESEEGEQEKHLRSILKSG